LREDILNCGYGHGFKADLMVAAGSSLRVNPAADMAATTARNGGKFVIINLQKTPLDALACLQIHAKIDDVIEILMKKLNLQIPTFKVDRYASISITE